jgi:hypothetical protein
VGLKDVARRPRASVEELDAARLQDRFEGLDATRINQCPVRCPVKISGEIKQVRISPRSGFPALEVVVSDGSGEATAVFTGRRSLGGIHTGRGVVLEGVAHEERGRRVILNPAYTLLPE